MVTFYGFIYLYPNFISYVELNSYVLVYSIVWNLHLRLGIFYRTGNHSVWFLMFYTGRKTVGPTPLILHEKLVFKPRKLVHFMGPQWVQVKEGLAFCFMHELYHTGNFNKLF